MALPSFKELAFGVGGLMIGLLPVFAPAVRAEDAATVHLALKDHRFDPAEPHAPAGKPITIEIRTSTRRRLNSRARPCASRKSLWRRRDHRPNPSAGGRPIQIFRRLS